MATDEEIADKTAGEIMDAIEENRRVIVRSLLKDKLLGAIRDAKRAGYMGLMTEVPAENHHMQLED
jgi:hypothetical protein